jgi:hypothetical protein
MSLCTVTTVTVCLSYFMTTTQTIFHESSLMHRNAMLNIPFQNKQKQTQTPRKQTSAARVAASLSLNRTRHVERCNQTGNFHWPQDFASMPSGGRVSTLPLLTSSQFVLKEVPLLSV